MSWVKGRIRFHHNPHVFHIMNIHYCHGLETKKKNKQSVKRINFGNTYKCIKHKFNAFLKEYATEKVISFNIVQNLILLLFLNGAHNFFIIM